MTNIPGFSYSILEYSKLVVYPFSIYVSTGSHKKVEFGIACGVHRAARACVHLIHDHMLKFLVKNGAHEYVYLEWLPRCTRVQHIFSNIREAVCNKRLRCFSVTTQYNSNLRSNKIRDRQGNWLGTISRPMCFTKRSAICLSANTDSCLASNLDHSAASMAKVKKRQRDEFNNFSDCHSTWKTMRIHYHIGTNSHIRKRHIFL